MHIVYKNRGETPLQCIQRLFDTSEQTYTYAGRLDPMASGLLLVLEGAECRNAENFHSLEKEYTYSFAIGVETDTYDLLGCVQSHTTKPMPSKEMLEQVFADFVGTYTLPYPPYSSKTVNGVPLFEYARQGRLAEITIPERTMVIQAHTVHTISPISLTDIRNRAVASIQSMQGDFRQEMCVASWEGLPAIQGLEVRASVSVGAGTYVRAIVTEIGKRLGCPVVTTAIERTRIGRWGPEDVQ